MIKVLTCASCGSKDLVEQHGSFICGYCGTKVFPDTEGEAKNTTEIALELDIKNLLRKCKEEPDNRRRYANLILDIDPNNQEAIKYLR